MSITADSVTHADSAVPATEAGGGMDAFHAATAALAEARAKNTAPEVAKSLTPEKPDATPPSEPRVPRALASEQLAAERAARQAATADAEKYKAMAPQISALEALKSGEPEAFYRAAEELGIDTGALLARLLEHDAEQKPLRDPRVDEMKKAFDDMQSRLATMQEQEAHFTVAQELREVVRADPDRWELASRVPNLHEVAIQRLTEGIRAGREVSYESVLDSIEEAVATELESAAQHLMGTKKLKALFGSGSAPEQQKQAAPSLRSAAVATSTRAMEEITDPTEAALEALRRMRASSAGG